MNPITPNPMLGIGMHGVGAAFAANCYSPQKYVKQWAWEVFWIAQASWCWLLLPLIGAWLTIPQLSTVIAESPHQAMAYSYFMGVAYGIGGMAFNVSIRYIGFSLTYSIAVGLSSVLGTVIPPLVRGQAAEILSRNGSGWVIGGIVAGALGIAICGTAGRFKEKDLDAARGTHAGFSLPKGLLLSIVAGVLSAVYGFALEAAKPIVDIAEQHGAGIWKGNVAYVFANTGAFTTSLVFCAVLLWKNRTAGQFARIAGNQRRLPLNYLLAFFTGLFWYGQFFFYNLGHVRLGKYEFSSWAIHMILLVLISNAVGIFFREWAGCRGRTRGTLVLGLAVLTAAVLFLTWGNYIGDQDG